MLNLTDYELNTIFPSKFDVSSKLYYELPVGNKRRNILAISGGVTSLINNCILRSSSSKLATLDTLELCVELNDQ